MRSRAVAALALGCVGIVPTLASAAPVDTGRMASVSVTVPLSDAASLELDIQAAQMSAGPQLAIHVLRCTNDTGCAGADDYLSSLPSGALSVDPSAAVAHLHTTLDGQTLDIVWRPDNGVVVGAGYVDGGGSSATASHFFGDAALATVRYAGSSCTGDGGVGQGIAANIGVGGESATAPVSQLHLPAATTLRC